MKKFFEKFLVTDKTPTIECDTLNWFMGNEDYEKRFKKTDVICDDLVAVLYEIEEYCRDNFIIAKNYQIIMLGEDYIKWFDEKKYEVENLTTRKER